MNNAARWIVFAVATGALAAGCGRSLSRMGFGAQQLRAPKGAQKVLNIAFHKSGDDTVKDVVFIMNDCSIVAREYRDVSPFEGSMVVVTHDGKPFKQAGCVPIAQ